MEISQHGKTVRIILERGPGSPDDHEGALDETKALQILKDATATMVQGRRDDNELTRQYTSGHTILDDWMAYVSTSDKLFTGIERFHALVNLARVAVTSCHVVPKAALADPANAAAARVITELYETDIENIPAYEAPAKTMPQSSGSQ